MKEENGLGRGETLAVRARGGAGVGAGFGGLVGAVVGWLLGAQVTSVPTIGPVVGEWVLPSTIVGLLAGAAIGALVGALAAITTTGQPLATPDARSEAEEPILSNTQELTTESEMLVPQSSTLSPQSFVGESGPGEAVALSELDADEALPSGKPKRRRRSVAKETPAMLADSMPEVEGAGIAEVAAAPRRRTRRPRAADAENGGPVSATADSPETSAVDIANADREVTNVRDEQKGRDPNTFTGTTDAIDPETGAVGTAGTPVTTGYGVSGSTVGTGSRRRQKNQEKDDFRGATPDSASYDVGGRGTGDAGVLRDTEQEASVVDRNSDAGRVEGSIPRDREGRDVYEQSEGYVESLERDTDQPPAIEPTQGTQESAGTNIPGTGNVRGLGDNTDK